MYFLYKTFFHTKPVSYISPVISGQKAKKSGKGFWVPIPLLFRTSVSFYSCEQRAKRTCLRVHLAVLCAGGTRLAPTEVERRPAARVKYPDACIAARLMPRMLASGYLTFAFLQGSYPWYLVYVKVSAERLYNNVMVDKVTLVGNQYSSNHAYFLHPYRESPSHTGKFFGIQAYIL